MACISSTTRDGMVFSDSGSSYQNMGIGGVGDQDTLFKRKFRFLFGIEFCIGKASRQVAPTYVKSASRPKINIDPVELNFLNETTYIPGKAKWGDINVTYLDVAGAQSTGLFSWLASVYDFTNECRNMGTKPKDYAGVGHLTMLDGCGKPLETWILKNLWPTDVDFGDLGYADSEVSEISLTLKYSNVEYVSWCGGTISTCGCSSC